MTNLRGKMFKNNLTGEVVKVLDSFEYNAILEDKSKVDVRHLINPGIFTEVTEINSQPIQQLNENLFNPIEVEEVKPESFFSNQNAYNTLADKIKNIPQHLIKDDPNAGQTSIRIEDPEGNPTTSSFDRNAFMADEESIIVQVNPDDERAALAAKYGVVVNPTESINKQNEAFSKLLDDENQDENMSIPAFNSETSKQNWNEKQFKIEPIVEDPIIRMFKGVKRNLDFNVSIDIDNKIPRIDFIEMMEDSYETSIIDFLADEFTNNIVNNPEMIKDIIKTKIKEIVYGEAKIESIKPTPPPTQVIREGENPVTKVKAPRKIRNKKEEVIK